MKRSPTLPVYRGWLGSPGHDAWLNAELSRLLRFPQGDGHHPIGGFAHLNSAGAGDPTQPVETWITARMTHVYALAHLYGIPGARRQVLHGVEALTDLLRDHEFGGWYTRVESDGTCVSDKDCYQHAFVVLAATSAATVGVAGSRGLLEEALAIFEERFWDEDAGRFVERFSRDWTWSEPYRGANSNMHAVEAALAAGDVASDPRWHDRALRAASWVIDAARQNGWRLIEHFDEAGLPKLGYNQAEPTHPFRPYGTTVGHWLEWARLLLQLEATIPDPPSWLEGAAVTLFDHAVEAGWQVDGRPGFVYTLDWDGTPVARSRMHWVLTEAISAAAALQRRTSDPRFESWYRTFWDLAEEAFVDRSGGSWFHELDENLSASASTWAGKPDLYHAVQATLLPRLEPAPSIAPQLAGMTVGARS